MHPYLTERMLRAVGRAGPAGPDRRAAPGAPRRLRLPARAAGPRDRTGGTAPRRGRRLPGDARAPPPPPARASSTRRQPSCGPRSARGRLDADAVDAVLAAAGHRRPRRREGPAGLTAREVEVLRLLARGLSNKQIAERLVISPKTAGNHVEHIYTKIGASNRAMAGLFAVQHGLLPEDGAPGDANDRGDGERWGERLMTRRLRRPYHRPHDDDRHDADDPAIDEQAAQAFAGRLMELYTGGMLTYLVDIGHRTGLFDAAARRAGHQRGARRARRVARALRPRVAGRDGHRRHRRLRPGDRDLPAATRARRLPRRRRPDEPGPAQPADHLPRQARRRRRRPRSATAAACRTRRYRPEFTDVMDALRPPAVRRACWSTRVLPLAPGLTERLAAGAPRRRRRLRHRPRPRRARRAPSRPRRSSATTSTTKRSTGLATKRPARGSTTSRFEVRDAATAAASSRPSTPCSSSTPSTTRSTPDGVLGRIHAALVPGGMFLMKEPRVSSNLEDNIGNPFAPFIYSVSTLHCLTVSLAHGGAGLGTAFGEQVAREMLDRGRVHRHLRARRTGRPDRRRVHRAPQDAVTCPPATPSDRNGSASTSS